MFIHLFNRKQNKTRRLGTEPLEDRRMLAAVQWDGGGDGVSWSDAANWDVGGADQAPANGDDVVIDVGVLDPVIEYTTGTLTLNSLTSVENVVISGGSLTFHGSGQFLANLSLSGGTLRADGAAASVTATTTNSLAGASLRAINGGSISLPASAYGGGDVTLEAVGTGSLLDLSSMTTLAGGGFISTVRVEAEGGGFVDLSSLAEITGGATRIFADGTGSLLDLSSLTSFVDTNGNRTSLLGATNSGTVDAPQLAMISAADINIDATSTMPTAQFTSILNSAAVTVSGTPRDFSGATNISGSRFTVSGGATINLDNATNINASGFNVRDGVTLALPSATSYVGGSATLMADGIGSTLDLSALTTMSGGGFVDTTVIDALNGGTIDLSSVLTITGGATDIEANGAGSQIDFASLASFVDTNGNRTSALRALQAGAINVPVLIAMDHVDIQLDATGTMQTTQLTSMVAANVNVSGASQDFNGVTNVSGSRFTVSAGATVNINNATNIDGAGFIVNDGATLSVPSATSFNGGASTLAANGSGSLLDLSSVTTMSGGGFIDTTVIDALNGGTVDLSSVVNITGGATNIDANGTDSLVDFASLTSFVDDNGNRTSIITPVDGGTVNAPLLTSMTAVDLSLNGTGTLATSQLISAQSGRFTITGTHVDFSSLTNIEANQFTLNGGGTIDLSNAAQIDGASFFVNDGVTLTLPSATSYSVSPLPTARFIADGVGSLIDFSNFTSLFGGTFISALVVEANNGGEVDLSSVPTMDGGATQIFADGGSVDLSNMHIFTDTNGNVSSIIRSQNAGNIQLGVGNVLITAATVTLTDSGTLSAGTLEIDTTSVVNGTGALDANLVNSGRVKPGDSPGSQTITGDFTQTATGMLDVEIAGPVAETEFDVLHVTGTANLGGTLNLTRPGGFLPSELEKFEIITHADSNGAFAAITGEALSTLRVLDPIYATGTTTLNTVPEAFINDIAIVEGDAGVTQATFDITLSTTVGHDVSFDFSTRDGFATAADTDFLAATDNVEILAGAPSGTITINIPTDAGLERDESFFVDLFGQVDVRLTDPLGVATILNDDVLPEIDILDATVIEPSSGTATLQLTVELSAPAPGNLSVGYATSNGTATAGDDYMATSGTLDFGPATVDALVSDGSDGALSPGSNTTIALPADGVLNYTSINIPAGVTVTFTRNAANTPAILLAQGDVQIDGSINVSSSGRIGGVGGGDGGLEGVDQQGPGSDGTDGTGISPGLAGLAMVGFVGSAGGGGGMASAGLEATHRPGPLPGAGGPAVPLSDALADRGGSGGGGGGGWFKNIPLRGGDGGGAGGGIVISSSLGQIVVEGSVRANGSDGDTAFANAFGWGGAGGGGSGGVIDLQADSIVVNGTLQALGGVGGGIAIDPTSSGANGGDGYIRLTGENVNAGGGTLEGSTIIRSFDVRQTIDIPIFSDMVADSGETIFVTLSAASGGIIADGVGVGTIVEVLNCDFNIDGSCNITDIDLLYAELGGSNADFDLDESGLVDNADVAEWLLQASIADPLGRTFKRGDANLDGSVGGSDFTLLAANFGGPGGWSQGNFSVDPLPGGGIIGGPDFTVLASNFGFTSATAVPSADSGDQPTRPVDRSVPVVKVDHSHDEAEEEGTDARRAKIIDAVMSLD